MQIRPLYICLLACLYFFIGCNSTKEYKSMSLHALASHEAQAYVEPDLTAYLKLFSTQNEKEEIERNFVEGCTQMMRGNLEEALTLFEKVLAADPKNHPAQYNSARIYHELGQYEEAVEYAQKALSGQANNYWYHQFLVKALSSAGNIAQAIEIQADMVERFPKKLGDRMELAEMHIKNQDVDAGLKVIDQIEKERGPSRTTSARKYEIYTDRKDYTGALESVTQLLETGEQDLGIYQMQYEALVQLGRTEDAANSLEQILEIDPENGFALLSLADIYKRQNQIEKSDQYLFRAFGNPSINPQGKLRIIEQLIPYAMENDGVRNRVTQLLDIFDKTHPENPEVRIIQGRLAFKENPGSINLDAYREALDQNPQQVKLWLELLAASDQKGDSKQLQADAELALEYYPNQSQFLSYYGKASIALESFSEALYAYKKLKKIAASDKLLSAEASLGIGAIFQKQDKDAEAKPHLDESNNLLSALKDSDKRNPRIHELFGDYYALRGVPELAEEEWKLAIKKGANFKLEDKFKDFGIEKE